MCCHIPRQQIVDPVACLCAPVGRKTALPAARLSLMGDHPRWNVYRDLVKVPMDAQLLGEIREGTNQAGL
jgi:hypothetical protein